MAYARRNVTQDATWCRAWTCDAPADLVSLAAVLGTGGPRRGDFAYVTSTGDWYVWNDTGWLIVPQDVSELSGILGTANGGTGSDLSGAVTGEIVVAVTGIGDSSFDTVAPGSTNQVLQGGGAGQPTWEAVPLVDGIEFPATQVPSANANTLDDYEEGSWTPVIGGDGGTSGQAYSSQVGRYTKIGTLVAVYFDVALSTKGTITGNAIISGLPFAAANITGLNTANLLRYGNLGSNCVGVIIVIAANTSVGLIRGASVSAANDDTSLVTADITNTTYLSGTLVYRADA